VYDGRSYLPVGSYNNNLKITVLYSRTIHWNLDISRAVLHYPCMGTPETQSQRDLICSRTQITSVRQKDPTRVF
jgi:hypothetical protein